MVFSSPTFIFLFFPAVFLTCLLTRRSVKWSNAVLLIFSLLFYAWGEPVYVLLMAFTTLVCYICARMIAKGKNVRLSTAVAVIWGIGTLVVFKYTAFLVQSFNSLTHLAVPVPQIALPVGISFFTFQAISYVLDVKRGDAEAAASYADVLLYISLFPQLIAGPIVRYSDIEAELTARAYGADKAAYGARRFILGLGKKVLIANVLAELVNAFKASGEKSTLFYWVYAAAYMLHVYFDFSGYSDMAIGLGSIFGFTFPENFNYPYIAASITEFWRRWHMSLSSWFRDYVYIPLGGSRVKKPRALLNIATVWMLTGLWHGADWNFVMWGIMFAALLIAEKTLLLGFIKNHRAIGHIYTLFFVMLCFIMFDASGVKEGFETIAALFGANAADNTEALYYLRSYTVPLTVAAFGATPWPKRIKAKLEATRVGGAIMAIAEPVALAALLCLCTAYLIDGSFNPFLYFRF